MDSCVETRVRGLHRGEQSLLPRLYLENIGLQRLPLHAKALQKERAEVMTDGEGALPGVP